MRIRKLRCSFCRKKEDQVAKLVAGPRLLVGPKLYICNECVAVASSIMQGATAPTPETSRTLFHKVKECWHYLLHRSMSRTNPLGGECLLLPGCVAGLLTDSMARSMVLFELTRPNRL